MGELTRKGRIWEYLGLRYKASASEGKLVPFRQHPVRRLRESVTEYQVGGAEDLRHVGD